MPTNRPVPRPLCLQPDKPSGSPPAGARVCMARPGHTCPKGLTPLAPHTMPLPTNTPSRSHPRFPFPRGPDPDSTSTSSKPGMASPSAPNIWRLRSPKVLVLLCVHSALLPLPPVPTRSLSASSPSLPVSPSQFPRNTTTTTVPGVERALPVSPTARVAAPPAARRVSRRMRESGLTTP